MKHALPSRGLLLMMAGLCLLAIRCADVPSNGTTNPPATVQATAPDTAIKDYPVNDKLTLTDEQWKQRLTPEQYDVLRRHGTEPAFCGGYTKIKNDGAGVYHCAGCGAPLFANDTKFESHSGWPSFFRPLPGRIATQTDNSAGMQRTEVHCARCGGHLGHVFDDGPAPTGQRYCINAICLTFVPATAAAPAGKP